MTFTYYCIPQRFVYSTGNFSLPFQNAGIKQGREKEKLKVSHDKQTEELLKDIQKVLRAPPHPSSTQITSIETVL